jgi:hypothetical protein
VRPLAVDADIVISIHKIEEQNPEMGDAVTRLQLEWQAAKLPSLFPLMKAELSIYPLTASEAQLDFLGHYEPPFGAVGKAINAIVGYRIAEVSVHRFVGDVAAYLRQALTK